MSAPEVSGKCPEVFQRHAEAGRMSQAFFPLSSGSVHLIRVPEVIAFDQHTAFVPECCTHDHSPCCGTFDYCCLICFGPPSTLRNWQRLTS